MFEFHFIKIKPVETHTRKKSRTTHNITNLFFVVLYLHLYKDLTRRNSRHNNIKNNSQYHEFDICSPL